MHFTSKALGMTGCAFLLAGLCGCGPDPAGSGSAPSGTASPAPSAQERNQAFGKVLWDIYLQGVLPDGSRLDYVSAEFAAGNQFAILDIDGDGKEELLLLWTEASTAGSVEYVFGYDNGSIVEELAEYPQIVFYDNKTAEAFWSHNQGLSAEEDFWPYTVYVYDAEQDIYRSAGAADAWGKSRAETYSQGSPFPEETDADGDGTVYFLLPPDWQGEYSEAQIVDGEEYGRWRRSCLGDAKRAAIPWQPLTEENIAVLGYPEPDIPAPTPAG